MDMVTVRWTRSYAVQVRGRLIRPGDTFAMPREEALVRDDVEIVEAPAPSPEPESAEASPPEEHAPWREE